MSDDVRFAFAALGLTPDSSLAAVRRRYRALVRMWHPDRFASDPQAVTDATIKMRVINRAYHRILEVRNEGSAPRASTIAPGVPHEVENPFHSLTRDEIDGIIEAINRRPTWRERLSEDPWNRGLSLLVAVVYAAFVARNAIKGVPNDGTAWFTVCVSPVLLHYIWSDERGRQIFGWMWLVIFVFLLPWFSAVMRRRILG